MELNVQDNAFVKYQMIRSRILNVVILTFGFFLIFFSVWIASISLITEYQDGFSIIRNLEGIDWVALILESAIFVFVPMYIGLWCSYGAYKNLRNQSIRVSSQASKSK